VSITLTITGTEQLMAALQALGPKAQQVSGAALYQEAELIMADSKEFYVPVDTGTLKNSGHVQQPEIEGATVSVTMGYGGAAEDYAIVQHERLEFRHPVGGPKYLERPLLAAAANLAERLAGRIRGMFT
jgi:hypothetical protein